jgi:putative flippase GtrA
MRALAQHFLSMVFSRAMAKWWIVGISFVAVNVGLLYALIDVLKQPVLLSTIVAAEIGTIFRFFVNDWWVFQHRTPTWWRLLEYHVANAGSIAVWWLATNAIVFFGGHYVLASLSGMACSVFLSMVTNFFWIWRHRSKSPAASSSIDGPRSGIEK